MGVPRNLKLARECFEEAARLGEPTAMSSPGTLVAGVRSRRAGTGAAGGAPARAQKSARVVSDLLPRARRRGCRRLARGRTLLRASLEGNGATGASGTRLASHCLARRTPGCTRRVWTYCGGPRSTATSSPTSSTSAPGSATCSGRAFRSSSERARRYFTRAAKSLSEAKEYLKQLELPSVTLVAAGDGRGSAAAAQPGASCQPFRSVLDSSGCWRS